MYWLRQTEKFWNCLGILLSAYLAPEFWRLCCNLKIEMKEVQEIFYSLAKVFKVWMINNYKWNFHYLSAFFINV